MSTVYVKAYYRIGKREDSISHNVHPFDHEDDADNAAWLCATIPGCVSAQVIKRDMVTPTEVRENVVRVYARNDSGFVDDITEAYEALRQLREAGAKFEVC